MKKGKLLALLSVLMIAAMLLSSCGAAKKISKVSSFEKVLNTEYDSSADVYETAKALTELNDYIVVDSSDEFILLSSATSEGKPIYKVFAFRTASVVLTVADTEEAVHVVSVDDDTPIFVVSKTAEQKTTHTAYDAKGSELVTTKYLPEEPAMFADLVLYANVLYDVADDGKLTKSADLPEHLELDAPYTWNDNYLYFFTANDAVLVFDRDLHFVSSWYAPSAADEVTGSVLEDGNVLVQYSIVLDSYAEEYDYYESDDEGNIVKYDLVTMLLNAKNGKTKDLDVNYVISSAISVTEWNRYADVEDYFADGVENIAWIYPIVDQKIDETAAAMDVVLLDNNGKTVKSIKLADAQAAMLPEIVAEDVYLVSTLYGQVLTDAKGEILQTINNGSMYIVDGYVVGQRAIYDLGMNKVYDLLENDATVATVIDDTIFIMKGEDTALAYEVITLRDGEQKTICNFSAEGHSTVFFTIDNADCYALLNTSTGEYTYYNAAGKELVKSKSLLTAVSGSEEHGVVVLTGVETTGLLFYAFAD